MNEVHLHLLINHVPVLTVLFSMLILGWGLIKDNRTLVNLSLMGFIIAGIFAVVAFQSGEAAEEIAERIPDISEEAIHEHEEAGELAQWLSVGLGILAIGGLFLRRFSVKYLRPFLWVVFAVSIFAAGSLAYTANLGGKIRHPEMNDTYTAPAEFDESDETGADSDH